jgi:hypothetical protein
MLVQFIQSKTLLSIAPRQGMVGFASIGLVGVWAKNRVLKKKKKKKLKLMQAVFLTCNTKNFDNIDNHKGIVEF